MLTAAIVVSFLAYVGLQVAPTVNEYVTIKRAVDKIAASSPASIAEIRSAFETQKNIEYAISSISGSDLKISKENDRFVIAFQYERELPLGGPVFLLLKYQGRSK
ncbi:MAG: DUF4845 domain-containing protein [Rubrivivax sp.]|nr:DUF4845 domain-containing protein [Rubrivivax sp.]